MQLAPFLLFDGNCREAINFYAGCFGGLIEIVTYAECPSDEVPRPRSASGNEGDIIYSALRDHEHMLPFLTAADLPAGSAPPIYNGQITMDCSSEEQLERFFQHLSHGGKVVQPLTLVFWSARIARLVDQYGVNWLLSFQIDG